MTPQEAFNKLRTQPEYFLKHYPLNTAGKFTPHQPNQVNSFQYVIYKKENAPVKAGHFGATRPGTIIPGRTHNISSFKVAPTPGAGDTEVNHQFAGLSVPMVYYDQIHTPLAIPARNINAMEAYLLDNTADVMITGQLSNCCFCITPYLGGLACTHVNPRGAGGPLVLENALNLNGAFANYPGPLTTFGRSSYPAHAIVIGVRSVANGWRIYAQLSNDLFATMAGAYRVYPGPLTPL